MKKLALLALLLTSTVFAQYSVIPEVTFNYANKTGSKSEAQLVKKVWGNKLKPTDTAFALITSVETPNNTYIFSMLNSENSGCIAAPNGTGSNAFVPLYSTCAMRVIQISKATKKAHFSDIPNYCYLNLNDEPGELAKNHTEYTYNEKTKTVHFRTIQDGKHIKTCDRSIKLQ